MYIEAVPNRDSPPAILLRESYREAGKVKKRTLLNLSDWPHERIAGLSRIRTCMGLFLSSGCFWFFAGSLFGAGKPFFIPSPAIRFAKRAEGVK